MTQRPIIFDLTNDDLIDTVEMDDTENTMAHTQPPKANIHSLTKEALKDFRDQVEAATKQTTGVRLIFLASEVVRLAGKKKKSNVYEYWLQGEKLETHFYQDQAHDSKGRRGGILVAMGSRLPQPVLLAKSPKEGQSPGFKKGTYRPWKDNAYMASEFDVVKRPAPDPDSQSDRPIDQDTNGVSSPAPSVAINNDPYQIPQRHRDSNSYDQTVVDGTTKHGNRPSSGTSSKRVGSEDTQASRAHSSRTKPKTEHTDDNSTMREVPLSTGLQVSRLAESRANSSQHSVPATGDSPQMQYGFVAQPRRRMYSTYDPIPGPIRFEEHYQTAARPSKKARHSALDDSEDGEEDVGEIPLDDKDLSARTSATPEWTLTETARAFPDGRSNMSVVKASVVTADQQPLASQPTVPTTRSIPRTQSSPLSQSTLPTQCIPLSQSTLPTQSIPPSQSVLQARSAPPSQLVLSTQSVASDAANINVELKMRADEIREVKWHTLCDPGFQYFLERQLESDGGHLVTETTVVRQLNLDNSPTTYSATETVVAYLEQNNGSVAESMDLLRKAIAGCDSILTDGSGRTVRKLTVRLKPRSA
ncbi:uncharacterized protein AB675_7679 [Cyphellophora attinorum]|uniref:Uncharacterized protein n=1 Tax=Cyphellophora attinorum TaxID=1664694 RepID=A0A0N1H4U1_9EURO|nr:uncharacterized protein AB675_7679 [Phialophora attinorum]KPI40426.1 hypothetical protein AB675_7679 [Phialophora attinorum]